MGVVKGAVGCAVVALLLGHQLSNLDPGRRAALWDGARAALGGPAPGVTAPRAGVAPPLRASTATAQPAERPMAGALPQTEPFGEERIAADRMGQFQTAIEIDGRRVSALIDTGATFVALSAEDADRIGVKPAPSDFRYAVDTANGRARVAEVQLATVRLGGIELRDVTALVSGPGQLGQTLLGMSFLSRLSSVRIDGGRLLLTR